MSEGDEKEEDEGEGWDKVESVTLDDGFVNQGHGMYIEDRIKLGVKVMAVLKKIIDDENLRNELIQKGLERIKNFSWEKCAQETLEILHSV